MLDGQVALYDLDSWSGKTSMEQEALPAETEKAKTSQRLLKKSSKPASRILMCMSVSRTQDGLRPGVITLKMEAGALLGDFTTRSFGESPSAENVSRLSWILEASPHPKYCLSERACQGILNRAAKRGKELPPELKAALEAQATPLRSGGRDVDSVPTMECHSTPHSVAYGISSFDSNAMKSDNPHSGIYEADTARTLDLNGGSPACNQGGIAVVDRNAYDARGNGNGSICPTRTGDHQNRITDYTAVVVEDPAVFPIEGNGQRESHRGDGYGKAGDPSFTINTVERHGIGVVANDDDSE